MPFDIFLELLLININELCAKDLRRGCAGEKITNSFNDVKSN